MNPVPESHADILQKPSFAHVATIGPDGEPQTTPVWIDWDGARIRFSQTKTRQKYHNLERDPRIAVSAVDPDDPYRYLEIRGRVVDVVEDADKAFSDSMAKKYLGKDAYPWDGPDDERIVLVVEPEHTTHMG